MAQSPFLAEDITILCSNKDLSRFRHEFRDTKINFNASPIQLGTIGHMIKAINDLSADRYLIHYGDMVVDDLNYDMLDSFHESRATIVTTKVRGEYGLVDIHGRKVTGFTEKPIISTPTWTGIMLMDYDEEIKKIIREVYTTSLEADIGRDLIPEFVRRGWVDAYNINNWIDIGSASKYLKYIST